MCIFTVFVGIASFKLTTRVLMMTTSASASAQTAQPDPTPTPTQAPSPLNKIIASHLAEIDGTVAVAIKNLKTGETYYRNEHEVFQSASLYKLWVMATVYEQIESGKLKETEELQADIVKLNEKYDIATEEAEIKEGTLNFTVGSALTQMITISHNYAAYVLVNRVGMTNVKKFLTAHGFEKSMPGSPPKTTAYETALFLEKLYKGELGSAENTGKMTDLLKKQKINAVLPKYLPEATVIGHKTGDLGTVSHDAGIVYSQNGDYIIVLLSKSSYVPDAKEAMAKISESVFNYFEE